MEKKVDIEDSVELLRGVLCALELGLEAVEREIMAGERCQSEEYAGQYIKHNLLPALWSSVFYLSRVIDEMDVSNKEEKQ